MVASTEIPDTSIEGEKQPAGVAYYQRIQLVDNNRGTTTEKLESYILTPGGVTYIGTEATSPEFATGILVFRGDGSHVVVQVDDTNLLRLYNRSVIGPQNMNVLKTPFVKAVIFDSHNGLQIVDITSDQDSIYKISPENRKWHLLGVGRDGYAHSVCLGTDVEEIIQTLKSSDGAIQRSSMGYNQN